MNIYCDIVLFSAALIYLLRKLYLYGISLLTVSDLKIPKSHFVRIVLQEIERKFESHKQLNLEIKYYQPQQVYGRYYFNSNLMVIYVSPKLSLLDLVDTLLHEYCHHLQNQSQKAIRNKAIELYDKEYYNHPWEVEARKFANKYSKKILRMALSKDCV